MSVLSNYCNKLVLTPTTKAVGSELVKRYQPTALVVGLKKKEVALTFDTTSPLFSYWLDSILRISGNIF
jgi:hypothetical protein